MSHWTTKKRQEFAARRGARMTLVGQQLELQVERYLEELKVNGLIDDFIHHKRYSPEDFDGRDFTVKKSVNGESVSLSFGVTISLRSWHRSQRFHQNHRQFCFPVGTKKETIISRVLELFALSK